MITLAAFAPDTTRKTEGGLRRVFASIANGRTATEVEHRMCSGGRRLGESIVSSEIDTELL
jgi:hypothetical protein